MKKVVFFLILSVFAITASAQEQPAVSYKNNVAVNPFAFAFGNLQFTYERMLTKSMSLDLEIGIKMPVGLMKLNGFDSPTLQTNDFGFKGVVVTPTFRWYFSKNDVAPQKGFYAGGYYRYRNVTDNMVGTYHSSKTGVDSPVDMDVNINTSTFGILLGYKLPICKHWDIDFMIAGPGLTFGKIKTTENSPVPDEFYNDFEDVIHSNFQFLDSYLKEIAFDAAGDASREANIIFPAFRYGFKVGYSF